MEELAPGLLRWTARSPDWSPGFGWEPDVSCFVAETADATLVIDPLLPDDEPEPMWRALDDRVEERKRMVAVLLTQAAHARSAGDVARRYDAGVWGHPAARPKVGDVAYTEIAHGDELPGGAAVLTFDEDSRGSGTPIHVASHRAVAVGDVFITVDGELRVWWGDGHADEWYAERLVPSLRRWLDLPIGRLLVAHGPQVEGGTSAIAAALERPPYRHE